MQSQCLAHQKSASIYDLTLHTTICERCALFDSNYQGHSFIETQSLPNHVAKMMQSFESAFMDLRIDEKRFKSFGLAEICDKIQEERCAKINAKCDEKIRLIEQERKEQLRAVCLEVDFVSRDSQKIAASVLEESYLKLKATRQQLKESLESEKLSEVCQILQSGNLLKEIESIGSQLDLIRLDIELKLQEKDSVLPLIRRKSSKDENLLSNLEVKQDLFELSLDEKDEKLSCKSICKTEISFSLTERSSLESSRRIPTQPAQSTQSGKATLVITNKGDIRSLPIKPSIRQLTLTQLTMNDREAIDAIKHCASSFVTRIDLSGNFLTQRFLAMLKREKLVCRHLKTVIVKGIQLGDKRELKKEGIVMEGTQGKVKLGDLTIQY